LILFQRVRHELRTPLTAINGWAMTLRAGRLDATQSARALETIVRGAKAQNQLINDLLDVSRIISGKMRLDVFRPSPSRLMRVGKTACAPFPPATSAMSQSQLSRLSCWPQWRVWSIEPERMRNSTETQAQRNAKSRGIARLFELAPDARAGVTAAFHGGGRKGGMKSRHGA
jgi:hypothetical protein